MGIIFYQPRALGLILLFFAIMLLLCMNFIIMATYKQIIKGLGIRPEIGFFGYSSVTLVKDGEETILFDTGGPGVRGFLLNYIQKVKIDKVFVSHLHFDHCCNIDLFAGIPIYLNKKELDGLLGNESEFNKLTYLVVNDYLKKNNFILFDKKFQLTKNIEALPTYGHTRGHSSLKFKDNNNCNVILAGDAIETHKEYLSHEIPSECYNKNDYIKTKKFIITNADIIVPGHSSVVVKGKLKNNKLKLVYF